MVDTGAIEYEDRMSASDALMWRIEKDPLLRSTITTVILLDQVPDRELLDARLDRLIAVIPRLRQRVVGHAYSIAPPRWEDDPNFDLSFHIRWVRCPGEGTLRDVLDLAEPIAMQGFDRARPLWEAVAVEGLRDGQAAVILKIHHAITDGVGGVRIQMELLDLDREAAARTASDTTVWERHPAEPPLNEVQRIGDALAYESRRAIASLRHLASSTVDTLLEGTHDPVGVGTHALDLAGSLARFLKPAVDPLSPLMVERSLSVHFDTMTLDLQATKRAAKVVGGKLNDAFVSGVAIGLRRYHAEHGYDVEKLRMTMPVSIRTDQTAALAGNQFTPARFEVPVGIDDPIALMTEIREVLERQRHEPALALTEPLASVLNRLPTTATTAVFGSMLKGVDFIATNVPGPPVPVFMAGAEVLAQFAFAPLIGAAVNVALLSYQDDLNVGINTDPAAIPDPDVFHACLQAGFDEILALG